MKHIRFILLIVFLTAWLPAPVTVYADEPSPWAEVLNPDGTVQWDHLVDLGVSAEPADWMTVTLPGGLELHPDATYHRYQTPSGNILVLPSPVTLFLMAQHPEESGLNGAQSMLGNGAAILALLAGPSLDQQQLETILKEGYHSPQEFFQAVIDGKANIWTVLNVNFIYELLAMSYQSGFLVNALLLYLNEAVDCAQIPGGCSGLALECADGDCGLPQPQSCPVPTIQQGQPQLVIQKIAPQKPLVVGQDPAKRGADVGASVSIPPVIFTWYEEQQGPPSCHYTSEGNGEGCSGPGSQYEEVLNSSGQPTSWDASMEGNPSWAMSSGKIICIQHVETLPEPIDEVRASAQLNPESRDWILTDLAGKYYDAYIRHPSFNLLPGMGEVKQGCDGSMVCFAEGEVIGIPFADPGTFDLEMWAWTAGTMFNYKGMPIPITSPRLLYTKDTLQVYVTLVTLLPAGAP